MTENLFNRILAICLLFSSYYLPVHAETASQAPAAKTTPQTKKSAEASFLEGNTCLKQNNNPCARLALANIPSTSVYAKLLQGSIASNEKQTDQALMLLLPLQSEENLIPQAKISLHLHLAAAFENLDDTQQAVLHFIQAETTINTSNSQEHTPDIKSIHESIWALLSKVEQNELIELRGNNTDDIFQGWIDLRLAANNHDLSNSIAGWRTHYPDHPAQTFAKTLPTADIARQALQTTLASAGSIALIMPPSFEAHLAKADAFRQGLQAALLRNGLQNPIKTYTGSGQPQDSDEALGLAEREGNAYFILPSFNTDKNAENKIELSDSHHLLHINHTLDDEAQHIINFAMSRGMHKIIMISTQNAASASMAARLETAWNRLTDDDSSNDAITRITLPDNLSAGDSGLLELKAQLSEKTHDMVVLAMRASEARLVRPHLPISTPVMTFSNANEILDETASYQPLNAVRLYEMPYLLDKNQSAFKNYETQDGNLNSNELLRWFALGVDCLQLLAVGEQLADGEISVSGLSGLLTVSSSGMIHRQLQLAIMTHGGTISEQ